MSKQLNYSIKNYVWWIKTNLYSLKQFTMLIISLLKHTHKVYSTVVSSPSGDILICFIKEISILKDDINQLASSVLWDKRGNREPQPWLPVPLVFPWQSHSRSCGVGTASRTCAPSQWRIPTRESFRYHSALKFPELFPDPDTETIIT